MSVIVKCEDKNHYTLYAKGSPEMVASLCNKKVVVSIAEIKSSLGFYIILSDLYLVLSILFACAKIYNNLLFVFNVFMSFY